MTICYLYVAISDSSVPWGKDILIGTQLAPGGIFDVTLPLGIYKAKAIDCDQTGQVLNENLDVTKNIIWYIK